MKKIIILALVGIVGALFIQGCGSSETSEATTPPPTQTKEGAPIPPAQGQNAAAVEK